MTWARLELALIAASAVGALAFDAWLPGTQPTAAEYTQVDAAVRAGFSQGDAVAAAPEWASRAREVLHGLPFLAQPDLLHVDYSRVRHLWLVAQPQLPRSDARKVMDGLAQQLALDGAPQTFGHLVLQKYANPKFLEPKFDFTHALGRAQVSIQAGSQRLDCQRDGEVHRCQRVPPFQREWREVDFKPFWCIGANGLERATIVFDYPEALLGSRLELVSAVTGEMAWKHGRDFAPVSVAVEIDGNAVATLTHPAGTVPASSLSIPTDKLDPTQPHRVRFLVSTPNAHDREFCFDARSY